jgi:hypothetical protein
MKMGLFGALKETLAQIKRAHNATAVKYLRNFVLSRRTRPVK